MWKKLIDEQIVVNEYGPIAVILDPITVGLLSLTNHLLYPFGDISVVNIHM